MLSLNLLAYQTLGYKFSHIPLHPGPPIVSLNRMVHLGRTRMHRIHCTVSFIQNFILKPIHIWHTQPMIQQQNTIIQSESGYLTQLDSVDETQKLWIARLSLLYLLSQD